ncbi:MAG: MraY family glycosyltransferase [Mucilaginibacter sp.]
MKAYMHILVPVIFLGILFILELIYFKIADRWNIIDRPNHRSSHTKVTIRGGGVIFPAGCLLVFLCLSGGYVYFIVGLLLISMVSFMDDMNPISKRLRIIVHLISVALLFYQLGLFHLESYWILLGLVFVIGTINAINFMDGINGITGGYALVTLVTLYYINRHLISFTNETYLVISILSSLVFNFFNFRVKAKCFAGDVGSVSIAFMIAFFLLQLILKTNNLNYLFLLLIYGLDSSTTILFRIMRKEKIFEAHRSHFYQFLSNEKKISHLIVASGYAFFQLIINAMLLNFASTSLYISIVALVFFALIFVLVRFNTEGYDYLTKSRKIINT